MFTLNRLSIPFATITLGLGLLLGGCASETEEPDTDITTTSVEAEQAAAPVETAEAATLPPGNEENLGTNASEIGFYGGWGAPMMGGWGWGGARPMGVGWGGAGWGWGGGGGWGGGWGGGIATSTTVVNSSTMVGGMPGWGWGMGCMGCW